MRVRRLIATALLVWATWLGTARGQESPIAADFRSEGKDIHDSCVDKQTKSIIGCATTFVTGSPLHIAFGTIAPQNGIGIGPALVWHWTPSTNWRWTGSADAVRAGSGAWRAGAYATIVRTKVEVPQVVVGGGGATRRRVTIHPYPVIKLYSQSISLPQVFFFGIGPNSSLADKTLFGMRENVTGSSVIWPITPDNNFDRLVLSLFGELNGRWVAVRSGPPGDVPSIEQRFTDVSAPGLSSQPAVVQFGEGVRISPSLAGGHLRLNYSVRYQQFQAPSESLSSFQRWTVDLHHEIPIYGSTVPGGKDTNTPNDCATSPTDRNCPKPAMSRNRSGSISLRAMMSRSIVSGAAQVPFYFQQTLGGSDLDGNRVLASYEDYRFRGPHLVLFQETFEHSLFGSPIGIWLSADQGRVSAQNMGLEFNDLAHSYAVGFSLRAGGLPVGLITWATGPEGHHFAFTISSSLLGGSSRPALQ
jgi:hypothetical protein